MGSSTARVVMERTRGALAAFLAAVEDLQPEEWVEDWHGHALRDVSIRGLDAGVVTVCEFIFPAASSVRTTPRKCYLCSAKLHG